jgi:hypothetical protein
MKYKIAVLFSSGFVLFSVKMRIKNVLMNKEVQKKVIFSNIKKVFYDTPVTEASENSIAS